jgi:hypothetical protein
MAKFSKFDIAEFPCDKKRVKAAKTVIEKKTAALLPWKGIAI